MNRVDKPWGYVTHVKILQQINIQNTKKLKRSSANCYFGLSLSMFLLRSNVILCPKISLYFVKFGRCKLIAIQERETITQCNYRWHFSGSFAHSFWMRFRTFEFEIGSVWNCEIVVKVFILDSNHKFKKIRWMIVLSTIYKNHFQFNFRKRKISELVHQNIFSTFSMRCCIAPYLSSPLILVLIL